MSAAQNGVCIISQYWEPDVNGDVVRLKLAIAALRKLGHRVTLITSLPHFPAGDKKGFRARLFSVERTSEMTTVRVRMPAIPHSGFGQRMLMYAWFAFFSAFPTLAYGRQKYVWAFSQRVFSTYTALVARLLWGSKLVSDVTDVWPEALLNTGHAKAGTLRYSMAKAFAKPAYKVSSVITTLTEPMKDMLVHGYGLDPARVVTLPLASAAVRGESVRVAGPITMVYFGNVGPNYDFDSVIQLAADFRGSLIVKLIGEGTELPRVRREVARRRLTNFEVHEGMLQGAELWRAVAGADVFVLPMKDGPFPDASFPTKLVDYLALGRPVVYLGAGYAAKVINENHAGVVGSGTDMPAVEAYLKDMASRGRLIEEGERASATAERLFSMAGFEGQLASVFN